MFLLFLITVSILAIQAQASGNVQSYQQGVIDAMLKDFGLAFPRELSGASGADTCIPGTVVQVGGYYQGVFYMVRACAQGL